jgi:hypothetical protein
MVCFMGSLPERGELIPNLGDAPNLNWFYLIVHFFCSSKRTEKKTIITLESPLGLRVRRRQTNQRKGRRKCQLQPKRAPATLAKMALPFCLQFAPFPELPSRRQIENFASKQALSLQAGSFAKTAHRAVFIHSTP